MPILQRIPADGKPAERCMALLEYAYDEAKNKQGRIPNKGRIYFGLVDEMAAKYRNGLDAMETYVTAAKYVSDNMGMVDNLKGHYTIHVRHMMRKVVGLAAGSARSRDRMQKYMREIFSMYMRDESEALAGIYLEALAGMCAKAGGEGWWEYATGMFESCRGGGGADMGNARRSRAQVLEAEAEMLARSGQGRLEDFLAEHRRESQGVWVRYVWLLADRDAGQAAAEAGRAAEAFPDSQRIADVLFHTCGAQGGPEYVDLLCRTFVRTYNWWHYDQAKSLSGEWDARMESIMSEIRDGGNPNMCVDILLREGMDRQALDEVLGSGDLDMLDAYVHELGQRHPEEFRGRYAELLPKAIRSVRSAGQYEDARRHVTAMQAVPGHKKDAARFTAMLRRRQARIAG